MRKRAEKYPTTVAFRTTNEFKKLLEERANQERKSVSEYLQDMIKKGIIQESPEFIKLLTQLAKLRGKGEDWIRMKTHSHRRNLVEDAHHGYCENEAINDLKEEIKSLQTRLQTSRSKK